MSTILNDKLLTSFKSILKMITINKKYFFKVLGKSMRQDVVVTIIDFNVHNIVSKVGEVI